MLPIVVIYMNGERLNIMPMDILVARSQVRYHIALWWRKGCDIPAPRFDIVSCATGEILETYKP